MTTYLRFFRIAAVVLLCLLGTRATTYATPIGVLSYDVLVPGTPEAPGINALSIFNATGGQLLPDFPIDSVAFENSALTLTYGDLSTEAFILGALGAGGSSTIELSASKVILQALFTAVLGSTSFAVCAEADCSGTLQFLAQSAVSTALAQEGGGALIAGEALAVIDAAPVPDVAPVPEPGTLALVGIGVSLAAARRRRVTRA